MTDDDLTLPGEASITTDRAESSDETPETKAAREATEKKLTTARKQFRASLNATSYFREQAKDDTKFRAGIWGTKSFQWPAGVQEERASDGRPCITVNRIPGFIRQVTNLVRQARLRILVSPVDDKSDPKLAEVLQSIIRQIEVSSWADRAYAMGSEKQAEIGLGIIGLSAEWAEPDNEKSFRKRIKIDRKRNPLAIYVDATAREADWSDADYAFEVFDLDEEAYELHTGKTAPKPADYSTFASDGDAAGDWFPNGKIRIAKWYNREAVGPKKHIALLTDGAVIPYPTAEQEAAIKKMGVTVKQSRYVQKRQIVCREITGVAILEESIWPAKAQPYIPVIGDELEVDGELDWRGVTRDAKGSAQGYNVQVSAMIEAVGMGQKAPVVGYTGQFGKPNTAQRRAWETANRKPVAFLEVEELTIDGVRAPIPQRVTFEPPIQGVIAGIQQTNEDLMSTAGFRDASLGERGPQESGKAIIARQKQDELGSSHYLDNTRFALCSLGRQLIQLIRVYYDEPTVLRITGKDGKERKVQVFSGAARDPRNSQFQPLDPATQQPMPYQPPAGVLPTEIYDLSAGEFDVEVSAGHDSGTRRQEAVEAMTALFQGLPPEIAAKFLDLYFLVMDFPLAQQMAERAKKLLPPELQDADEGGTQEMPPQAVAQLQALQGQLQQASQALQALQQEVATDAALAQAKERMFQLEQAVKERLRQAEIQAEERTDFVEQQRLLEKDRAEIALKERQAQLEINAEIEKTRIVTEIKVNGEVQIQQLKNESAEKQAAMQAKAQKRGPRQLTFEKDANGDVLGALVRELDDDQPTSGAPPQEGAPA